MTLQDVTLLDDTANVTFFRRHCEAEITVKGNVGACTALLPPLLNFTQQVEDMIQDCVDDAIVSSD